MQRHELSATHCAFLARPGSAARQHVGLATVLEQLHLDSRSAGNLLPFSMQEFLLKVGQPPPGCADQISRTSGTQVLQIGLADDPPVKHPYPSFVAVLLYDRVDD